MKYIRKQLTLLLTGILSLLLLLYLTHTFSPKQDFIVATYHISILIPFFLLLFVTLFGFSGYFIKSKVQGVLIGVFVISFLMLRYYHFTHWFFLLLLFILFLLIEIIIFKTN